MTAYKIIRLVLTDLTKIVKCHTAGDTPVINIKKRYAHQSAVIGDTYCRRISALGHCRSEIRYGSAVMIIQIDRRDICIIQNCCNHASRRHPEHLNGTG